MPERLLRDEAARLATLADYEILDTPPETPFERVVQLVCSLLRVPMATVTFVDAERQWFKARRGVEDCHTSRKEAICDYTIRSMEPLMVPDLRDDPRFADFPAVTADPPLLAYLGVPLVMEDGSAIGALCAMDHKPHHFNQTDVAALQGLAGLVVDWLEMRRISRVDFLTGAMTRRAFDRELEREIARFRRHGRPCALAVFDIDHFKAINDRYGHAVGDRVLRQVTEAVTTRCRLGDRIARLGGEEFAVLLPESDRDEAIEAAEALRTIIAEQEFPAMPGHTVTASFGVASFSEAHDDAESWLNAADRALYRAKEAGRNRTAVADGAPVA